MKLFITVLLVIALCDGLNQIKSTAVTSNIHERVAALKIQIAQEIKEQIQQSRITPVDSKDTFSDDYEYVDIENKPITPIMNFDERKKGDKFKLKEIVSKTTNKIEGRPRARLRSKHVATKRYKKKYLRKPTDIFYRRAMTNEEMDTPLKWIHCECLITPFLEGYKCNKSKIKIFSIHDNIVIRLIQLININTTDYSKEEVYSVLYQISNLNIKFFQWDLLSLKHLFKSLSKDPEKHTFRSVKNGLKRLFASWHLDIGNLTNLLKQARIFRPPCVLPKNILTGSTMSSLNTFTGKIAKHRKQCKGISCKN